MIEAGLAPGAARFLIGIFCIHRGRENCVGSDDRGIRASRGRWPLGRRQIALTFPEIVPVRAVKRAGGLGIFTLIVSACDELCMARAATSAAAENKTVRGIIGGFLVERLRRSLRLSATRKTNRSGVNDVHAQPATRSD